MKLMKLLYTVLLSFCTLTASAGLRITDKNSVQAESLTFATQFLQQNWQPVNITGQNFFPNDESRKTPDRQLLSGKWILPGGELHLKSDLRKIGTDSAKLSLSVQAQKEGITGRLLMVGTSFPVREFASRRILVNGKNVSFPAVYDSKRNYVQGRCNLLEIPLQNGKLLIKGPFWYRLQDNRAYGHPNWALRIHTGSKLKNGLIQSAALSLEFQFEPYSSHPLPLTGAANTGFTDDIAEDRRGGWTDQGGENDFRSFPQEQQTFAGIPFQILNEKTNPGKTCIALRGKARPYFPAQAELKLKQPIKGKYLYLLHCVAWPTRGIKKIGTVTLESSSAEYVEAETVRHDIKCGEHVGNFWEPKSLKYARIGWKGRNAATTVGLYISRIPLNGLSIRKISFESTGKSVWMIAGATVSDIELTFDPLRKLVMKPDAEFMELKESGVLRRVEAGSILDFSGQLDAPAGKYGFLTCVNGQFEFEKRPGVPVRFYGVNIAQGVHFMTNRNMDRMVEHLAATGYNLVRFHHFDGMLAKPTPEDPLAFDPVKLERLDMLTKKLRDKGIYITVDIYTCRKIGKGEIPGLPDSALNGSYKGLIFVHQPAMDNFLRYMRKLMTHRNRYTGLTWAEDPAICKISLINENTITAVHEKTPFLRDLYRAKFKEYCAEKRLTVSGKNREQLWSRFLVDTYEKAFRQLRTACRELRIKAPVTDQNFYSNIRTSLSRELYDYVDNHFYNNHPVFIGPKQWTPPIALTPAFMVENYAGQLLAMARSRLFSKPFTVSEWDYVNPNPYAVEGAFETAACAATQGWSSLERFCYAFGEYQMEGNPAIHTFSMITDPLRLLSERAGVLFFLRGDVRESKEIYPILLPRNYFKNHQNDTPSNLLGRLALLGKTGLILCDSVNTAKLPENTACAVSLDDSATETEKILRLSSANRKLKLDSSRFRNDTGEVELDAAKGTFLVQTARSEAFLLKEGTELRGKFAIVKSEKSFCAVLIAAMDGRELRQSSRYLLLHLTQTANNGMEFQTQDQSVLERWSVAPRTLLIRRGEAKVTLDRELSGFRLYALDLAGKRLEELPVQVQNGKTGLHLKTDLNSRVVAAYELVR